MSDYIKRDYCITNIEVECKECKESGGNKAKPCSICKRWVDLALITFTPSANVIEVSKILKTADEQEKQGFIQTAKVLRELVSDK